MGPASGLYYIKNLKTGYYLTATQGISANTTVETNIVNDGPPPNSIFSVQESGGQYTVSSYSYSLNVGAEISGNPRKLIWQRGEYKWNFLQSTPGIWNIRIPTENRFWFDNWAIGKWVILKDSSTFDECNWQLIAA